MYLGKFYIPEPIIISLILTNAIFSVMTAVKLHKLQNSRYNPESAILDRLISIVGDCSMKFIQETALKHKDDNHKKILTPEDVLVYIESYIKQLYARADNDESRSYYRDLLNVFYSTYDSSRDVIIDIISDMGMTIIDRKQIEEFEKEEE